MSVGTMLSGTVVGRRDVCPAVQGLYQQMMDALLHQKSREECLRLFHAHMGALVRGQYMLEQMVITKGVREAMDADERALSVYEADPGVCARECRGGRGAGCEGGLWNRAMAARFGHTDGYGYAQAYDDLASTGMHMYTTNGIRGRDFLGSEN